MMRAIPFCSAGEYVGHSDRAAPVYLRTQSYALYVCSNPGIPGNRVIFCPYFKINVDHRHGG